MMKKFDLTALKGRVSWGSVSGGVITALAVSILLSLLTSCIGLFMFDPLSAHPASGIGTTVGVWSAVTLVASMAAGGFVAGKLAGTNGLIHGFLVWATALIIAAILGIMLTVGAVKLTANALGSVSSVAGNVLSGAGNAAGNGLSALSEQAQELFGQIDLKTEMEKGNVPQNIRTALAKSGIRELQPDYLQGQLESIKADLNKSVKAVIAAPQEADDIIERFIDRLKDRADNITNNIDRNKLSQAIVNNTNLTKAEADKAIDQYMALVNKAADESRLQIKKLENDLQQATLEWKEIKQKALMTADEATDVAAWSALVSFLSISLAAVICSAAGSYGSRKTQEQADL